MASVYPSWTVSPSKNANNGKGWSYSPTKGLARPSLATGWRVADGKVGATVQPAVTCTPPVTKKSNGPARTQPPPPPPPDFSPCHRHHTRTFHLSPALYIGQHLGLPAIILEAAPDANPQSFSPLRHSPRSLFLSATFLSSPCYPPFFRSPGSLAL